MGVSPIPQSSMHGRDAHATNAGVVIMRGTSSRISLALAIVALLAVVDHSFADSPAPSDRSDPSAKAQALIDKGLDFLKSQQKPGGSWQRENDPPAITAIVLKAFV